MPQSPTLPPPGSPSRTARCSTAQAFGDTAPKVVDGEACFNTAMTGYQEVLTDPSYAGQIVAMTYPLIGNYGVNDLDVESDKVHVRGFVVRELARSASNYRSLRKLEQWLETQGVMGITGVDTRALTRILRIEGAMKAVLATATDLSDADLVDAARASQGLVGVNLVQTVTGKQTLRWSGDLGDWAPVQGGVDRSGKRYHVVALDCGAKLNILRNLTDQGCDVTVLPCDATPEQVMEHKPDGLFVSNGPGDPAAVEPTIASLKELSGKLPTFGICLGQQLLSLALGAQTYKLRFGHRGANHPIQNLETGKVEITSQNHGFAVDTDALERAGGQPTHINLNDKTLAGFRHKEKPIFAVQYHPEASPGPHDARYLFDCFLDMLESGQAPTGTQMDNAQRRRNRPTVKV